MGRNFILPLTRKSPASWTTVPERGRFSGHLSYRNKKGMKEFAVRWRISKFFHAVGWIIVLFLLNVFQTVKCYCRDNDDTFKYELEVCVDTEDCKGVDQYGENKYADYYA